MNPVVVQQNVLNHYGGLVLGDSVTPQGNGKAIILYFYGAESKFLKKMVYNALDFWAEINNAVLAT